MPTLQYTYNGDGQRVQTVESGVTKKQVWDEENILLETDGSDVTQVVYTQEPAGYGNLLSQRRGSTTSYYLFDALGSTRRLASSAGSATDTYEYRAYGELFSSTGSTINVFRWVGQLGYYYDVDREAYYVRARHYSPKTGRWLSQDPIEFEGGPWNLYEYAQDSPIGKVDPSGMFVGKVRACMVCACCAGAAGISCAGICAVDGFWDVPGEGFGNCFAKCLWAARGQVVGAHPTGAAFQRSCTIACLNCGRWRGKDQPPPVGPPGSGDGWPPPPHPN